MSEQQNSNNSMLFLDVRIAKQQKWHAIPKRCWPEQQNSIPKNSKIAQIAIIACYFQKMSEQQNNNNSMLLFLEDIRIAKIAWHSDNRKS